MNDWISEEFRALRGSILRIVGCFVLLVIIFFSLPVNGASVAQRAIEKVRSDFLPSGVALVARSPLDPFLAEAELAAELSLLLSTPLAAFEMWRWLSPALYRRERRLLGSLLFTSLILLVLGTLFTYRFVLPAFFAGLYSFLPTGVEPLFDLRAVVDLVVGMLLITPLFFLLPVAMAGLSGIGLVKPLFWLHHARFAVLLALILSAIITPDGTGITMMLLALPTIGLYCLGYIGARFLTRRSSHKIKVEEKLNHITNN